MNTDQSIKQKSAKKRPKDETFFGSIGYLVESGEISNKHIALIFNTLIIDDRFNFCDYLRQIDYSEAATVTFPLRYLSLSRPNHPSNNNGVKIAAFQKFGDFDGIKEITM